jgi:hypothetical protein
MKTLITILNLLIVSLAFASDVEIRFANTQYDMEKMYVDVEIKSTNGSFILGSQNLRVYYNTDAVALNDGLSKSTLSREMYSELNVVNKFEKVNADEVNQLSFDNDLGFANLTIELEDMLNGGSSVNGEWSKVAVLVFDVINEDQTAQLVWAREGKGDAYATAFVEMAEWVAPNRIITRDVNEFHDLSVEISLSESDNELSIEIGPNPSSDYVMISLNKSNSDLMIVDLKGKVVKEMKLSAGQTRIDIQSMSAGSYIFYVNDGVNRIANKILKVD